MIGDGEMTLESPHSKELLSGSQIRVALSHRSIFPTGSYLGGRSSPSVLLNQGIQSNDDKKSHVQFMMGKDIPIPILGSGRILESAVNTVRLCVLH